MVTALSKEQLRFVEQEIDEIVHKKVKALSFPNIPGIVVTPKELVAGIKAGRIKLKKDCTVTNVDPAMLFCQLFDRKHFGTPSKRQDKLYEEARLKIYRDAHVIRREIVLGTAQDALAMLKQFEQH